MEGRHYKEGWSARDKSIAVKMYNAGSNETQIAERLGRTELSVSRILCKELKRNCVKNHTADEKPKPKKRVRKKKGYDTPADIPLYMLCRRARMLQMSYGQYVGSRQYQKDLSACYFV